MADTGDKDGIAGFLTRPDGGLLALNLGTLSLVAGLEKFGDVQNALNLRILVGGLSVGLFFAILCAYFTLFGSRATVAAARRIGARTRFDANLVMVAESEDPWQGTVRFLRWLAFCLLPFVVLAATVSLRDDRPAADLAAAIDTQNLRDRCPDISTVRKAWFQLDSLTPEERNALTADDQRKLEAEKQKAKARFSYCDKLLTTANESRTASEAAWKRWASRLNAVIVACMMFYLFAPFIVWSAVRGEPYPAALDGDPRREATRRRMILDEQVGTVQSMRLAAAVLSLAAFMIGVGLALVNTGVTNIGSGLAEAATPIATESPASRVQLNVTGQPANNTISVQAPNGAAIGGAPGLVLPDQLTLKLDMDGAQTLPLQSVTITGLEGLKIPPATPTTVQLPSTVTFSGLPPAAVTVQPSPTPPPPIPPSAEEIAQAMQSRVMVKVCGKWDWSTFPPRRACRFELKQQSGASMP